MSMKSLALSTLALLLTAPLAAQDRAALRAEAFVASDVVTFGDIVDFAGSQALVPLFRAPALGTIGTIRAESIVAAARELGVLDLDSRGLASITIRRPAREIAPDDIRQSIRSKLVTRDETLADGDMTLDAEPAAMKVPREAPAGLSVDIERLDARTGRFEVKITTGEQSQRLAGQIDTSLPVPVLTRTIGRGDTLQPSDFVMARKPRRDLPVNAIADMRQATGQIARRTLPAGQMLREGDIARPDLVERNQLVTVSYEAPGITLTLRAKALSAGPAGAVVPVQHIQSKRTIETIVTGSGHVSARLDGKSLKSRE